MYSLGEDDWNDVVIACSSLSAKWQQLCGHMGLTLRAVRTIKQTNQNDSAASWNDAITQWILQEYNTEKYGCPSWKSLLKAIGKVDKPLFEKLTKEHQGMLWYNKLCPAS